MDAEARGLLAILTKQAQGYADVVKAAGGNPDKAYQLLMIEKLPELVKTQVEAVKISKLIKVTVWENGNSTNGKNLPQFYVGLAETIPPLDDLFTSVRMNLPPFWKGLIMLFKTDAEEVKDKKENTEEIKEDKK